MSDEEALPQPINETQRLLGRCLLRIQRYELLLKNVLGASRVDLVPGAVSHDSVKRSDVFSTMTLGGLATELFETFVVSDVQDATGEDDVDVTENSAPARIRYKIVMDAEKRAETQKAVTDMVLLRNGLVHHFIQRFDLRTEDGRFLANEFLVSAFRAVDERVRELAGWAKAMDAARVRAASVVSSPEFENLIVNGIQPNGDVVWECSGIVSGLYEAFDELAKDGWMSLDHARSWFTTHHPDQTPQRYGCASWKEVVHKSRAFRMNYRATANAVRVPGVVLAASPNGS